MRLRTTAPPSAFLMLNPNRVSGSWFARKKTVKWEFERRLPVRYTASNSPRRTNRAVRGNSRPSGLLRGEPMASLLAASRQNLAASYGLHAYAKSVCLGAPPFPRLICSLWQSNPPLFPAIVSLRSFPFPVFCDDSLFPTTCHAFSLFHAPRTALSAEANTRPQAASAAVSESVSVVDHCVHGQENCGVGYKAGKSNKPHERPVSAYQASSQTHELVTV
jgi:hypothetical protein